MNYGDTTQAAEGWGSYPAGMLMAPLAFEEIQRMSDANATYAYPSLKDTPHPPEHDERSFAEVPPTNIFFNTTAASPVSSENPWLAASTQQHVPFSSDLRNTGQSLLITNNTIMSVADQEGSTRNSRFLSPLQCQVQDLSRELCWYRQMLSKEHEKVLRTKYQLWQLQQKDQVQKQQQQQQPRKEFTSDSIVLPAESTVRFLHVCSKCPKKTFSSKEFADHQHNDN